MGIREQDPLKQGLKLCVTTPKGSDSVIREQDPLKQGLKLSLIRLISATSLIREQDPLKQGLKHFGLLYIILPRARFASKIH